MSNRQILIALNPCSEGLARAAESPTLREWWDTSTTRSDLMWLIGRAHSRGTLSRRALVRVAVRCCETAAHLMPPEALPPLADIAAWCGGADDVDLPQVRDALWGVRCSCAAAADAYAYAAAAAYSAAYAAAAADAADAYAAADAADAYAYAAAAYAADAAAYAADAAMCDVIRDAITIDEVCAALGLDPDQGVA